MKNLPLLFCVFFCLILGQPLFAQHSTGFGDKSNGRKGNTDANKQYDTQATELTVQNDDIKMQKFADESHQMRSYTIYPNPANEYINIENLNRNNTEIFIFDISGKMVKNIITKSDMERIDISEFQRGVYIVKSLHFTAKFVK
jgi:hypothetical protein